MPAVVVDQIAKQYRLGELNRGRITFREVLTEWAKAVACRRRRSVESVWALRDVSFTVERGEVLGIIGRNGAGKSTLLKILSRITYPTSGQMFVDGRIASLLEVGTGFHDELTGRENIYLSGSILGMRKRDIDARMDSIVEFAGVDRFLDTPVKRYSSGMRLRLGFAVAAHLEPDVLLIDEILAVGDAGFQKKCLSVMSKLRSGGRTVLFVSHDLNAIETLCPRTVWIDKGQVRKDGPSRQVIQAYLSTFADVSCAQGDLTRMKDRKGSGDARLTRIEFFDEAHRPVTTIRSGMPLTVRMHFDVKNRLLEPYFGIDVFTNSGVHVTSLDTWTTGYHIESLRPGHGYIDLQLGSLLLAPDRYYLSLFICDSANSYFDYLDMSLTLEVEEAADSLATDSSLGRLFGMISMPARWSPPRRLVSCDSPDLHGIGSPD